MILDEEAKSTWGWKQNSLVNILDNGEVVYNPDYYVMAHLSKYIKPGAKRIECACISRKVIAFKNTDESIVVYICNPKDAELATEISIDGKVHEIVVAPSSIVCARISE